MSDTSDLSRFDSDPDALAWARAGIERRIERCRDFQRQARERGNDELAGQYRKFENLLRMWFVGGQGCVIATFDERRPQMEAALAKSKAAGETGVEA